jgi:putative ABC transport system permease protein
MGTLLQDLKYAIRMLLKSPGFTAIAVLTLALGIGANTAIFSLVNAVLLRPLPYPDSQKLVSLGLQFPDGEISSDVESRQYVFWRDHSQALDSVAAFFGSLGGFNMVGNSGPVHVRGAKVSRQFFSALGMQPILGRGFEPDEDRPGGPAVAVISYGLWRSAFGGDRNAVGRSIILNGVPHALVGVLPPTFRFASAEAFGADPNILIPLQLSADPQDGGTNYTLLARLKPGVTITAAQAEADHLAADYKRAHPSSSGEGSRFKPLIRTYQQSVLADIQIQPILLVLFGAVGFVLLIACVNVANLFLSRATSRQREIAIRTTLGATTGRLFRQLLCEGLVFAAVAGAAGLALAFWGVRVLVSLSPIELPGIDDLSFDWRVLAFTLGVSVIVAVVCGSASAVHALRGDINESLKEGSERSGGAPGRRLSRVLVAGEVALSLVLLTGAGLLIATVVHLYRVPLGFDATNVLSAQMSLTAEKYDKTSQVWNFQRQVIERVQQLPGVVSVATASATPLERGLNTVLFRSGVASGNARDYLGIEFRSVSPSYFRTLSIPVLYGREFSETDSADSARVVVINQDLANELWPHESAIGKPLLAGEGGDKENKPRVVIGVIADIKEIGLDQPARPTIYIPQAQVFDSFNQMTNFWFASTCIVKTARPLNLDSEIRTIVAAVDPEEPVARIESMDRVLAHSIALQRFLMILMGIFAGLALVLAAVGIYGVLSYQIARRTHEIGIRMALGAAPGDVLRLVLREGMFVVFAGVVVGIAAAFGLSRFLASVLFGVQPADPLTFAAVVFVLVAVALLACYIPARRATRVDPLVALRYE